MNKILLTSILTGVIMFSGCGTTGNDNNTTDNNLEMLDADKPRIVLEKNPDTGSINIELSLGDTDIPEYGYSAYDEVDGDISIKVDRSNNINLQRVGTYTVTYFVEDTDGFTDTKTRTVTITDTNGNSGTGLGTNTDGEGNYDGQYSGNYNLGGESNSGSEGNVDLGEQVGGNTGGNNTGEDSGYSWSEGTGSSIESFKQWYSSVCNGSFNSSLYNASSGKYNGTITCSNRSLQTIDLRELSIFSSINGLDLSGNQLTDIDFSQLGLNQLSNNTKILYDLNIKNNNLSTNDFDLFKPLFYLKNINKIYLGGNNFNYTCDDLYRLRTSVLNNKSLYIDREVEQNCPSLTTK